MASLVKPLPPPTAAIVRRQHSADETLLFQDSDPQWVADGLIFTSSRIGTPDTSNYVRNALYRVGNKGELDCLLPRVKPLIHISVSHKHRRVLLEVGEGACYILDLENGALGRCNNYESLQLYTPTWTSDGQKLVVLAQDEAHPQITSLCEARATPVLGNSSLVQRKTLVSDPIKIGKTLALPSMSPDGKIAIFLAQTDEKPGKKNYDWLHSWAIFAVKIPPASSSPKPQLLVRLRGVPERVSWFPDSKRLIVSYEEDTPDIVNVVNKTIAPLKIKVLRDRTLKGSLPIKPHSVAVAPSGKWLAFSAKIAYPKTAKITPRYCLYKCRLNGSKLLRLTPFDKSVGKKHLPNLSQPESYFSVG